ncbi:MAG TPA: alpha/beta hydrolase [Solirubrobacteraceae bacterium]|nr:alpha/beta hydrolase [Solirubrobacteraceae bacterium]
MPVVFTPQNTHPSKRGSHAAIACHTRSESRSMRTPSHMRARWSSGNRTWMVGAVEEGRNPRASHQLADLSRDHLAVAPDLRGYNLSSKPDDVHAYTTCTLVEDVRQLVAHLGHERFVLVGHDVGGAVAWSFALHHPEMLSALVVLDTPHPAVFDRALHEDAEQQQASASGREHRQAHLAADRQRAHACHVPHGRPVDPAGVARGARAVRAGADVCGGGGGHALAAGGAAGGGQRGDSGACRERGRVYALRLWAR